MLLVNYQRMTTRCLSKQEAQDLLRWCLEDGVVSPHPHFKKALADDGLALPDAMVVLRKGTVFDEPEFNARFQQWRYRVEGREPGGKWLKIVFAFIEEYEVILITAFSVVE